MNPAKTPIRQWSYFEQRPFTRAQRATTTVLFGGLTSKHERLVRASLLALGYRSEIIPTPDVTDFQTGKEYGNYGQCNPTYFTTGSLINYLKSCESQGLSREDVVDQFVYITPASPCGPCRLGMYQNEYRLAADNAGFKGFRVIAFEQRPSLSGNPDLGLDVNLDFSMALVLSILMGDLINQTAGAIRPYEVVPGETDRVVDRSLLRLEETISSLSLTSDEDASATPVESKTRAWIDVLWRLHSWLRGDHLEQLLESLGAIGEWFDAIDIDRSRLKPVVKITGEFWAQTTEGDGNFGMFEFLEKEGAQLLIEPVASWLYHLIHAARQDAWDLAHLVDKDEDRITAADRIKGRIRQKRSGLMVDLVDRAYVRLYDKMRAALKGIPHPLIDQGKLDDIAHGFYHSRLEGGEGHLEVAKNIYYQREKLAHMVLSLKPFGCMPSTQSDAVQAAAQGAFGDMIFLPIETSGEGRVNALSRVQMALGEARAKARSEFEEALQETGLTRQTLSQAIASQPDLRRPSYSIPSHPGSTAAATHLAYHVRDRFPA